MAADSVKSAQMNSAAHQIAEYIKTIRSIEQNYGSFENPTPYDIRRIQNMVDLIESKLGYIENKMNTLDPNHLPLTFIIMPNGEQLSIANYVRLHKQLVSNYHKLYYS